MADAFNAFADRNGSQRRTFRKGARAVIFAAPDLCHGIRQRDGLKRGAVAEALAGDDRCPFADTDLFQFFAVVKRVCSERAAGKDRFCQAGVAEGRRTDFPERCGEDRSGEIRAVAEGAAADGFQRIRQNDGFQFRSAVKGGFRNRRDTFAEGDRKVRSGCAEGVLADAFNAFADRNGFERRAFRKGAHAVILSGLNLFQRIRQRDGFKRGAVAEALTGNGQRAFADADLLQFVVVVKCPIAERAAGKNCFCQTGVAEGRRTDFSQMIRQCNLFQCGAVAESLAADHPDRIRERHRSEILASVKQIGLQYRDRVFRIRILNDGVCDLSGIVSERAACPIAHGTRAADPEMTV